jgi:hypothetical protein
LYYHGDTENRRAIEKYPFFSVHSVSPW